MRILICAVPPHKITDTARKVECEHLRIIGNKDSKKEWQRLPTADLCIIIPKLMSQAEKEHVKRVYGKQFVSAPSLNDAIRIANDAAAADRKKRAA